MEALLAVTFTAPLPKLVPVKSLLLLKPKPEAVTLSVVSVLILGMASVFVSLQAEQVKVLMPSVVVVAGLVITPLSQLWPVAGMDWVVISPQMEQVLVLLPAVVQVGSTVTLV